MKPNNKSSLSADQEFLQFQNTDKSIVQKIKSNRKIQIPANEYIKKIAAGNISFLSKAITLIESTKPTHIKKANKIVEACLTRAHNSIRIGITGVPGVGKSTFVESFGKHLTSVGKRVAVLAVDPSSSVNKGSILADKTIMKQLVSDKNAFIRPSPSGTSLGGVASKTREAIILCEAAGFDTIIVETVGVGQSETAVHSMVDFFLLLKLAGAGDELQGIKRGIIEMADSIVINKADGDNIKNANIARVAFNRALHLYPPKENGWTPQVVLASALYNRGIDKVYNLINKYIAMDKKGGYFQKKRKDQSKYWLFEIINQALKDNFYDNKKIKKILNKEVSNLEKGKTTAFSAAQRLLSIKFK
ncbi:MAG: methylmalonyl Co-A mutase-associated GTPase MeaB [Tenacibaculum sp.]